MSLHVQSYSCLLKIAKLRFKKRPEVYRNLAHAQESLARELDYRDLFHARSVLPEHPITTPVISLSLADRPIPAPSKPDWCYYSAGEFDVINGQKKYIPSLVRRNEPGHTPMRGAKGALPWYWGDSDEEVEALCEQENARLGLDKEEAREILMSSIAAQNQGQRKRHLEIAQNMIERMKTSHTGFKTRPRILSEDELEARELNGEAITWPECRGWAKSAMTEIIPDKIAMNRWLKENAFRFPQDREQILKRSHEPLSQEFLDAIDEACPNPLLADFFDSYTVELIDDETLLIVCDD